MECDPETLGVAAAGHRAGQVQARRYVVPVLLLFLVVIVAASACSSESAQQATSTRSQSTSTTGSVAATAPAVPPDTKDCGTQNTLAGWPTTFAPPPNPYACLLDAVATGTPAQMSLISVGNSDSGRKTEDGYSIPTRRIVTWIVLAKNKVQVTTNLTEDGGTSTTRICRDLVVAGDRSPPQGTDCS